MWSVVHAEPSPRARGEHEGPRRGQDRAVDRRLCERTGLLDAALDARDHVHGDLVQVLGQVRRRVDDALELRGAWVAGRELGAAGELSAPVEVEAALVEAPEAGALVGVGHDDEVPALRVGAGRRLERDLDAALDHLRRDGALEVQTLPDGARRGEEAIDDGEIEVCHARR